jgi:hypothetical protein
VKYKGEWRQGKWHGDGQEFSLTKQGTYKEKNKARWRLGVLVV